MGHFLSAEHVEGLVRELAKLPSETEWVEFKRNRADLTDIGEYVSALANSAALLGKPAGYVVWGIEDQTHAIVGTDFDPVTSKIGNENLENWLIRSTSPKLSLRFHQAVVDGRPIVVLEVEATHRHPARFKTQGYIRVGSYKKPLQDHPERERDLWKALDRSPFEVGVAALRVRDDEVMRLLDTPAFFELQALPLPQGHSSILAALEHDGMIRASPAGGWDVTNLGAMLFARRLDDFPSLQRKALRVIQYKGTSRVETIREQVGGKGYANGIAGLLDYLAGILPSNEMIRKALRTTVPMFPELAIREIVVNAIIHQDFFVSGAGPMVELFADRMEVSNPGSPLISPERFLDSTPRSRNEKLASLSRRIGICEERGSGVDKVVFQMEYYQLPAPIFESTETSTRVVLLGDRPLTRMERVDRVRACYLHACLKYVNRDYVTNSSIRERFGLDLKNQAMASRLLREAVEAGEISLFDEDASPRYMKYVPWWAKPEDGSMRGQRA